MPNETVRGQNNNAGSFESSDAHMLAPQLERQRHREASIGWRQVTRYTGHHSDTGVPQSALWHLLEEAVLNLLVGQSDTANKQKRALEIGELRAHLRANSLVPVQEALRQLLQAKRGKPSKTRRFWDLLELPASEDSEEFSRFSEIVFYSTLYEMLLSALSGDRITSPVGLSEASDESDDAPAEGEGLEPSEDDEDSSTKWTSSEQRKWLPERQLYQRVWRSFLVHLVTWLSHGAVTIPRWKVRSAAAHTVVKGGSQDEALEELLERAFLNALETRTPQRWVSRRPTPLEKIASRRHDGDMQANPNDGDDELPITPPKPFHEAAEEFSANLVNIVAALTVEPDGVFAWFKRTQLAGSRQGLAAWVPTSHLLRRLKHLPMEGATYPIPVNAPLIVPPRNWTIDGLHSGGYYTRELSLYKFYLKNNRIRDFLRVCAHPDIAPALEAVNTIQVTPYRINSCVWDTVRQLVARARLLKRKNKMPEARALSELDQWIEKRFMPGLINKLQQGAGDRLCQPLTWHLVDGLAKNSDRGPETFYFAYQADSRGRLYAVTQWLSPQGEDLARALLEFADGKPITSPGARYLAVYGSQQIRLEKILSDLAITEERPITLDERLAWVEAHEAAIASYAADPLVNSGWTQAKQPFQFLAFCFAWATYRAHGPEAICNLPVHVDGVCNGLQHIAALTGDRDLARATNLCSGPPQDIYLSVKNWADQALAEAAQTSAYARFAIKKRLVDRDLAKKVVMIIPYGAGERGYTRAVRAALRARMFTEKYSFNNPTSLGEDFVRFAQESFPNTFTQTHDKLGRRRQPISEHLSALAAEVAEHFNEQLSRRFPIIAKFKRRLLSSAEPVWLSGSPMIWRAPGGLPAIQRNFHTMSTVVDSRISSAVFGDLKLDPRKTPHFVERIKFTTQRISDEVDKGRQASGLLPNFIHSLDCAHLLKTVQLAKAAGVSHFSVIHDSYGTHASDMPTLAKCLRQAFIDLYCSESISVLTAFEQWCAALSIAARAPHIAVEAFSPYMRLRALEKALYDLVATWAGRDNQMLHALAKEAPKLLNAIDVKGSTQVLPAAIRKVLLFAADRIELEWPDAERPAELPELAQSAYFFH